MVILLVQQQSRRNEYYDDMGSMVCWLVGRYPFYVYHTLTRTNTHIYQTENNQIYGKFFLFIFVQEVFFLWYFIVCMIILYSHTHVLHMKSYRTHIRVWGTLSIGRHESTLRFHNLIRVFLLFYYFFSVVATWFFLKAWVGGKFALEGRGGLNRFFAFYLKDKIFLFFYIWI